MQIAGQATFPDSVHFGSVHELWQSLNVSLAPHRFCGEASLGHSASGTHLFCASLLKPFLQVHPVLHISVQTMLASGALQVGSEQGLKQFVASSFSAQLSGACEMSGFLHSSGFTQLPSEFRTKPWLHWHPTTHWRVQNVGFGRSHDGSQAVPQVWKVSFSLHS